MFEDITLEKLEDLSEHVYPADIDPTSYYHGRYSAAIYTRLEDPGVLDPHDHIYMGILEMYNSSRDGYKVL
jgi:hypothetical protein